MITMGGSPAEKNAVVEFLHFGETSSAASEVSPGGRNHGGRYPPTFAGSTAGMVQFEPEDPAFLQNFGVPGLFV
jgi:hypothetical protein